MLALMTHMTEWVLAKETMGSRHFCTIMHYVGRLSQQRRASLGCTLRAGDFDAGGVGQGLDLGHNCGMAEATASIGC